MKGVIADCLAKLVIEKFGKEKWMAVLEKAGLPRDTIFLAVEDVDDQAVIRVIEATCKVLNISMTQAADAFGEYWMTSFAPKIYKTYYRDARTAKDFILKMNFVHAEVTQTIRNARPPKFGYEWKDNNTLVMKYNSTRGLIDIMAGLIRGVGKYYQEDIQVKKISNTALEIFFPS
ncbi:MAG: hypothetical protein A2521_08370 [Deltaproteobacteria bacterium RIFOXYD12_FULL_57_12]|nr:MAG: hypothetical protein A2521_08370 [Deltaproteobacteria bacterium RIFOXYD12_FULL_57_12]